MTTAHPTGDMLACFDCDDAKHLLWIIPNRWSPRRFVCLRCAEGRGFNPLTLVLAPPQSGAPSTVLRLVESPKAVA